MFARKKHLRDGENKHGLRLFSGFCARLHIIKVTLHFHVCRPHPKYDGVEFHYNFTPPKPSNSDFEIYTLHVFQVPFQKLTSCPSCWWNFEIATYLLGGAVLFTGGSYPIHFTGGLDFILGWENINSHFRKNDHKTENPPSQSAERFFSGWFQGSCKKKRLKKVSNSLNSRCVFLPRKEVNLRHVPKCLKALPTLPLNQQQKHLKIDAWKTVSFPFWGQKASFQGRNSALAVSLKEGNLFRSFASHATSAFAALQRHLRAAIAKECGPSTNAARQTGNNVSVGREIRKLLAKRRVWL